MNDASEAAAVKPAKPAKKKYLSAKAKLELAQHKKNGPRAIAMLLVLIGICAWLFYALAWVPLRDIRNQAPIVFVSSFGLMAAVCIAPFAGGTVGIALRMTQRNALAAKMENWSMYGMLVSFVCIPVLLLAGEFSPFFFLHDRGYHQCGHYKQVRGSSDPKRLHFQFTKDWVTNPDWCDHRQDYAKVYELAAKEQAAKEQAGGAR